MAETCADTEARAREAASLKALFEAARLRQQGAQARSPHAPRFLVDAGQSMAAHLGLSEQRMQESLTPMGLWQLYLPSTLGAEVWDFPTVRERLPWSYGKVRAAMAALETRPQVVATVFHMAAFPILCTLVGAAWAELHDGPMHTLIASRNAGWLGMGTNHWVRGSVEVLSTDPAGLRRLMGGLKDGSIQRLLILADGPQAPGTPEVRALDGVSAGLGMRTALLRKFQALSIPQIPITHEWDEDRLVVTPHPVLDPALLSEAETLDAVAHCIEDLLRRRPEQWLNWSAAKIRT